LGNRLGNTDAYEWLGVLVCFGQADLVMPMLANVGVYQGDLVKLICSCQSGRSRSPAAYHLAAADAPAGAARSLVFCRSFLDLLL